VIALCIAAPLLLLDQYSKRMVIDMLIDDGSIRVTSFLNFTMVWNKGISFGLFASDNPNSALILKLVAGMVTLGVIWFLHTNPSRYNAISTALIISGAIGNIIDRVKFGAVADFIDFHIAGYHYPAFNVADSCICIGVALIVLEPWIKKMGVKNETE